MNQYKNVNELWAAVVNGDTKPSVSDYFVTGASYIYQTTQFPDSSTKYHNYYLLLRVGAYFGACSHVPEQLGVDAAGELSGKALKSCLTDPRLPVRIAAMDAYFGTVYPHERQCSEAVELPGGTPTKKAEFRDNLIADIAKVEQGMKIALIGVVNPLIAAIRKRGGTCLPCDLQMERTHWGDPVEKDMEKVLDAADGVICTGMTLSNGTFDRVIERVLERSIPLTVYAQTGSAVAARFVGAGITSLVAEPFPFSQFSANATRVFCYRGQGD